MKILSLIPVVLLSGCALIFPREHDPVMFGHLVDVKISLDKLSCDDKNWKEATDTITRLKVYATLRNDPQADALVKLEDAIKKAHDSSNKTFCESVVKLNKTRVDVIVDAWKGR
jgi:hypothetical protein